MGISRTNRIITEGDSVSKLSQFLKSIDLRQVCRRFISQLKTVHFVQPKHWIACHKRPCVRYSSKMSINVQRVKVAFGAFRPHLVNFFFSFSTFAAYSIFGFALMFPNRNFRPTVIVIGKVKKA